MRSLVGDQTIEGRRIAIRSDIRRFLRGFLGELVLPFSQLGKIALALIELVIGFGHKGPCCLGSDSKYRPSPIQRAGAAGLLLGVDTPDALVKQVDLFLDLLPLPVLISQQGPKAIAQAVFGGLQDLRQPPAHGRDLTGDDESPLGE